MKRLKTQRKTRGSVLIESIISIALMVPITVITILVALEGSRAFVISQGMTEAAVLACRALSYEYKTNRTIVTDADAQQAIFTNIRIANMVHSNSQFEIAGWNLTQAPKTVTVKATYLSGYGNPPLPKFPSTGTLNLGGAFKITQAVTYRIQE
jgi:hypothetical protein